MKKIACVFGIIFLFLGAAQAQKGKSEGQKQEGSQASSGESSGLVQGTVTSLYGGASDMMSSKSGALLGQAGGPSFSPASVGPQAQNAPAENPPQEQKSAPSQGPDIGSPIMLRLNSGQLVKGKLVEQTRDYIKLDIEGVTTTYFKEEISKIE